MSKRQIHQVQSMTLMEGEYSLDVDLVPVRSCVAELPTLEE